MDLGGRGGGAHGFGRDGSAVVAVAAAVTTAAAATAAAAGTFVGR